MPSKEDLHFASDRRSTTQDFLARDVDDLVAEIKENLRLRSRPYQSMCKKQRATPYKIPSCKNEDSKCHSCGSPKCMRTCVKKPTESSDPYELLQILLEKGSLIKEAVKRLQSENVNSTKDSGLFYENCDSPILDLNLEL